MESVEESPQVQAEAEPTIDRVLFLVVDQWRGDALAALGTPGVSTPNLDALAAGGVVLANHWCQASPCGPSRRSLLTGTQATTNQHWTNDDHGKPGLPTLSATLRDAGVSRALIGYTDTPQPMADEATNTDPNRWRELVDPDFAVVEPFIWQHGFPNWRARLASQGYDVDHDHPFGLYAPDGEPEPSGLAPARYRAEHSDVAFLTDTALDLIGDRHELWPQRGLLHLNWLRPHPPMTPPRPFHRTIDPEAVEPPVKPLDAAQEADRHPYFNLTIPDRSMTEYLQLRTRLPEVGEREDRVLRAAYYGLVAEVDHHLGRLVDGLKRAGLDDSTMIVVTSDHGDALGDHWIYGRRGPFDGHFCVPCIIRDPRRSADATRGTAIADFTANIDLFPTICSAFGVDTPPGVEGRSLAEHLTGKPAEGWREHVRYDMSWADHARTGRSGSTTTVPAPADCRFAVVRTAHHRLVTFPSLPPMLFDLVEDPAETTDRSSDPTQQRVVEELLERMSATA